MIILKIVVSIILGLYGLWLAIGLVLSLPGILTVTFVIMTEPLPKLIPELIKEIPSLFKEWLEDSIFWVTFPFLILHALVMDNNCDG